MEAKLSLYVLFFYIYLEEIIYVGNITQSCRDNRRRIWVFKCSTNKKLILSEMHFKLLFFSVSPTKMVPNIARTLMNGSVFEQIAWVNNSIICSKRQSLALFLNELFERIIQSLSGTCHRLLAVLVLLIHERPNQPSYQHKNTLSKILFGEIYIFLFFAILHPSLESILKSLSIWSRKWLQCVIVRWCGC